MDEVDAVKLPMLFCLMDEICETPPQDFLANAQLKAQMRRAEIEKKGALDTFKREKGKVRRPKDGDRSG